MELAVVTGVSRGLGEQIARKLLAGGIGVVGVSRSKNADLARYGADVGVFYEHVAVDLTLDGAMEEVAIALFAAVRKKAFEKIYVVNNAAMLEPVDFAHRLDMNQVQAHYKINVFTPMELLGEVIRIANAEGLTVCCGNITSGAATSAIPGWSAYSSGKAAINMYTESVAAEQQLLKTSHEVFAFSPGVMDTNMQSEIRSADEAYFPDVEVFRSYKESGRLVDPAIVATIFVEILTGSKGPIRSGHVYHVSDYM